VRRVTAFILFVFSLSFALYPGEKPDYGGAIVVGSIGDASTLIPFVASDSASHDICGLIYNGLLKYDKNLKLTGDLAESWEVSPDNLTITFHLRKGVRWQDGKPFTARDCLFTYQKLIDPRVRTPYASSFLLVKEAKVIDDYTFQVTYKEPFSPGLSSWTMWIVPEHLLKGEDLNTTPYARNPVGTGPYKFLQWKTGDKIILKANPDYFEGRPYISRYIYRIIPDQATMFMELRAGGVDEMGLTPYQFKLQTDSAFFRRNFRKLRYPSFGYTYLGYNLKNPLFKSKKVRQALTMAIDREAIIKGVLLGLGTVSTGPFVPSSWAYNPAVKPFPYNPAKAKEMLKEEGWWDHDGDGIIDKDGVPFSFTIVTNQGNIQRKKCAEIIQDNLGKIGIKVEIRIIEWATFLSEFIDKKKFDAVILGWAGLAGDPDPYDIWHSSRTREGEFNFVSYKNKEVDELLVKARRTFDLEERKKYYHRIHQIIYDDQPYTFLYVPDSLVILHKRFRGVELAPAGIGYNFIKWWVPGKEQKYHFAE